MSYLSTQYTNKTEKDEEGRILIDSTFWQRVADFVSAQISDKPDMVIVRIVAVTPAAPYKVKIEREGRTPDAFYFQAYPDAPPRSGRITWRYAPGAVTTSSDQRTIR